jgi:hypothetical protein
MKVVSEIWNCEFEISEIGKLEGIGSSGRSLGERKSTPEVFGRIGIGKFGIKKFGNRKRNWECPGGS